MQSTLVRAGLVPALLSICAVACHSAPAGDFYPSSDDPMADVESTLTRAADSDRLALIVLGADWCHDSRAMASRLDQSPLAEVIEQHYVTVLVDIGYYETGFDVAGRFDVPIYYATPTVLIVDPETGRLVNADDRHRWGAADSIGMTESVEYFREMGEREVPADPPGSLTTYLEEVAAFEQTQAERVARGYEVVGPLLRVLDETGDRPAEFDERWRELAGFRNAIPRDLDQLRTEIQARVAAGERDFEIELPDYPPLSWEE